MKALVLAGGYPQIALLQELKSRGMSEEDIEKMYISGGFSGKIDIENAVKVGLLPREFKDKCIPINNSSLLGTAKFVCEKNNLNSYVEKSKYIDLSANPMFSELFVKNMMFGGECDE